MRAAIVHVTAHALMRWRERAAIRGDANVYEIIKAVKQSQVVKKTELLPYAVPRVQNSVYTFKDGILFILESITIDEYNLVTVICNENEHYCLSKLPEHKKKKHRQINKVFQKKTIVRKNKVNSSVAFDKIVAQKHKDNRGRVVMHILSEFRNLEAIISTTIIIFEKSFYSSKLISLANKKLHPAA